jgi:hypothetical protein
LHRNQKQTTPALPSSPLSSSCSAHSERTCSSVLE